MSDIIPQERRSWFGFFTKVFFCFVAFAAVLLTILANMGGNGDFHKASVEQFAMEITGFPAKLETLHNLTYFPSIAVDLEDLNVYPDALLETPVAHIDRAQISVSFWDVARQNGKMKVVDLQGLYSLPGFFIDKTVKLKHVSIVDIDDKNAKLEGQGVIDDVPLTFWMEMKSEGKGRSKKYTFEPRRNINIELGDIKITATMQNAFNPYLSLQDIKISKAGTDVITGKIDISDRRKREMTITGELKFEENGTVIKPDLVFDMQARGTAGSITSDNFNHKDFAAGSRFDALVAQLVNTLAMEATKENVLDNFFSTQAIQLDVKGDKPYKGQLTFKNNRLSLE